MMSAARGMHLPWLLLLTLLAARYTPSQAHFGSCQDHSFRCKSWAAVGWCNSRTQFMLANCPVSCNTCIDPNCFDRSHHCRFWVNRGYCNVPHSHILATCPHSCDACVLSGYQVPSQTPRQTITSPDFDCGRAQTPSTDKTTGKTSQTTGQTPGDIMMIPGKLDMLERINNNIQVEDTFCGATPISDRFLITAAHCVIDPDRPVRTVRLGELDFARNNEEKSRPVDYQVEKIIVHPDFNPNSVERYNDIALLKTVERITFNQLVFPYCLAQQRPPHKTQVIGAGFGLVNITSRSSRLQEAELEVVNSASCELRYQLEDLEPQLRVRYPQLLQGKDILCAAHPGRTACEGDSGGPLFREEGGRRYLLGVVSSGLPCSSNGATILPGLYVSVADHIGFIDSVVYGEF